MDIDSQASSQTILLLGSNESSEHNTKNTTANCGSNGRRAIKPKAMSAPPLATGIDKGSTGTEINLSIRRNGRTTDEEAMTHCLRIDSLQYEVSPPGVFERKNSDPTTDVWQAPG